MSERFLHRKDLCMGLPGRVRPVDRGYRLDIGHARDYGTNMCLAGRPIHVSAAAQLQQRYSLTVKL